MKDENKDIAEYILKLREEAKMTQNALASQLGVSDKAISKWEMGEAKPSTENLRKLAKTFNVSIEDLLTIKTPVKEKRIAKIVLTGGPCAGKTTALNWINNFYTKKGYGVIFVPETATELITSGISPTTVSNYNDF